MARLYNTCGGYIAWPHLALALIVVIKSKLLQELGLPSISNTHRVNAHTVCCSWSLSRTFFTQFYSFTLFGFSLFLTHTRAPARPRARPRIPSYIQSKAHTYSTRTNSPGERFTTLLSCSRSLSETLESLLHAPPHAFGIVERSVIYIEICSTTGLPVGRARGYRFRRS